MGAWGIGIYSNDYALDLRNSVKALSRLPFEPERLLEFLCSDDPTAATDATDSDHTLFWLVVADQFAKHGIDSPSARDRALAIIADGADLATMAALGMDEKSLVKRRKILEDLRARIAAPIEPKPRSVLKAPQKLLLRVGEVLIYPVCQGKPINPYTVGKDFAFVKAWRQDGWGALAVAERGREFDFLAWYRPLVICDPLPAEPTLAGLAEPHMWRLQAPGTLSARHYTNMQLKSLGCVSIDAAKLGHFFPERMSATSCAVSDISLANYMGVERLGIHEEHLIKHGYPPTPRINALADIEDVPETELSPGGAESEHPNLSGQWQGIFSYLTGEKPPGSFSAALSECDGRLAGEIHDETGAVAAARPSFATVEGGRVGRDVRFLKRYVSATKKFVPIQYIGEINDGATEIKGRWFLPGHSSGHFAMTRSKQPDA